ncbi:MAG: hypothetical protein LBS36_13625 [Oscillospiraceae bacterium]|jgi:hypothetical protein|nr:hypothetical protein [Oscillospiraceae bacterium]
MYNKLEALIRRLRSAPRAEWLNKGSRKKDNEAILVSRKEIVDILTESKQIAYSKEYLLELQYLYRKMMIMLADGEYDAFECEICFGIYRENWAEGRCPYCLAEKTAAEEVRLKTREREEL